uniref:Uncharacterized protein n=1 Tax=Chromera velia CCMP2878 TaxID=1169474 RepID=A0A0G4F260_9ALVE|eukprot:Cvel_2661.t1-p1 / transcript=Cvel_2661.t1 / gene=Cvel_2661 / organism=Chromera_velia_CCMP2878 / gene_product=hypothetical protein / transcript_product=hypothetical protein / location=Cvel_scaffold106:33633-37081(-) / protein_length=1058 / sequence_SO=supercontig / SO=protein_coding / is_pseudo=false
MGRGQQFALEIFIHRVTLEEAGDGGSPASSLSALLGDTHRDAFAFALRLLSLPFVIIQQQQGQVKTQQAVWGKNREGEETGKDSCPVLWFNVGKAIAFQMSDTAFKAGLCPLALHLLEFPSAGEVDGRKERPTGKLIAGASVDLSLCLHQALTASGSVQETASLPFTRVHLSLFRAVHSGSVSLSRGPQKIGTVSCSLRILPHGLPNPVSLTRHTGEEGKTVSESEVAKGEVPKQISADCGAEGDRNCVEEARFDFHQAAAGTTEEENETKGSGSDPKAPVQSAEPTQTQPFPVSALEVAPIVATRENQRAPDTEKETGGRERQGGKGKTQEDLILSMKKREARKTGSVVEPEVQRPGEEGKTRAVSFETSEKENGRANREGCIGEEEAAGDAGPFPEDQPPVMFYDPRLRLRIRPGAEKEKLAGAGERSVQVGAPNRIIREEGAVRLLSPLAYQMHQKENAKTDNENPQLGATQPSAPPASLPHWSKRQRPPVQQPRGTLPPPQSQSASRSFRIPQRLLNRGSASSEGPKKSANSFARPPYSSSRAAYKPSAGQTVSADSKTAPSNSPFRPRVFVPKGIPSRLLHTQPQQSSSPSLQRHLQGTPLHSLLATSAEKPQSRVSASDPVPRYTYATPGYTPPRRTPTDAPPTRGSPAWGVSPLHHLQGKTGRTGDGGGGGGGPSRVLRRLLGKRREGSPVSSRSPFTPVSHVPLKSANSPVSVSVSVPKGGPTAPQLHQSQAGREQKGMEGESVLIEGQPDSSLVPDQSARRVSDGPLPHRLSAAGVPPESVVNMREKGGVAGRPPWEKEGRRGEVGELLFGLSRSPSAMTREREAGRGERGLMGVVQGGGEEDGEEVWVSPEASGISARQSASQTGGIAELPSEKAVMASSQFTEAERFQGKRKPGTGGGEGEGGRTDKNALKVPVQLLETKVKGADVERDAEAEGEAGSPSLIFSASGSLPPSRRLSGSMREGTGLSGLWEGGVQKAPAEQPETVVAFDHVRHLLLEAVEGVVGDDGRFGGSGGGETLTSEEETKTCFLCGRQIAAADLEKHAEQCDF